ncbi:MAG: hypothetical protein ACREPL_02035 [Rhodanobacteraceae bacterium]
MQDVMFVLGAADPEMNTVEGLLVASGVPFLHASAGGKRVYPANAYRAEAPAEALAVLQRGGCVYLVECVGHAPDGAIRIDHHYPGDPGYGRPPADYWQASSLGQTVGALTHGITDGVTITPDMRMVAAADHCLGAAYSGECPGVEPDALMRWHVASRAAFEGRTERAVMQDVEVARKALRGAPRVELAPGVCAADMRDTPVRELLMAAAREGQCCLSAVKARDGRTKIGCLVGSPTQVETFMQTWAPAQHLVDVYGDSVRGFAGAYVPQPQGVPRTG